MEVLFAKSSNCWILTTFDKRRYLGKYAGCPQVYIMAFNLSMESIVEAISASLLYGNNDQCQSHFTLWVACCHHGLSSSNSRDHRWPQVTTGTIPENMPWLPRQIKWTKGLFLNDHKCQVVLSPSVTYVKVVFYKCQLYKRVWPLWLAANHQITIPTSHPPTSRRSSSCDWAVALMW
jgi:hypothetical protein